MVVAEAPIRVLKVSPKTGKKQVIHPFTGKMNWVDEAGYAALLAELEGKAPQVEIAETTELLWGSSGSTWVHPATVGLREQAQQALDFAQSEYRRTTDMRLRGGYMREIVAARWLLDILPEAERVPEGEVVFGNHKSRQFRVDPPGRDTMRFQNYRYRTSDPIEIAALRRLMQRDRDVREIKPDQYARFTKENAFVGWFSQAEAADMLAAGALRTY